MPNDSYTQELRRYAESYYPTPAGSAGACVTSLTVRFWNSRGRRLITYRRPILKDHEGYEAFQCIGERLTGDPAWRASTSEWDKLGSGGHDSTMGGVWYIHADYIAPIADSDYVRRRINHLIARRRELEHYIRASGLNWTSYTEKQAAGFRASFDEVEKELMFLNITKDQNNESE